jgi:hypothetical protein
MMVVSIGRFGFIAFMPRDLDICGAGVRENKDVFVNQRNLACLTFSDRRTAGGDCAGG